MPSTAQPRPHLPSAAEANAAIRAFVTGRTAWSPAALTELDRLRMVWQAAVRAELTKAA
ncbi:hypothetical protein LHJ74_09550 [Streptomyces sp. N2-109]|uniref:Uncharacterized protein n=1 Tax=Streptomyces gossypii TaxID=2883101 RepID=A0ABT2JSB9_9ACTN|nr:hypothetical protein [Streptomyces gossypii]MCT2590154.1 hypothetical protein [Streptomyces gossypii]